MTFNSHVECFNDRTVVAYVGKTDSLDPEDVAWRLEDGEDGEGEGELFAERLASLTAEPWADRITTLVIGDWGCSYARTAPIGALVAAASRLTSLRALFLGDIVLEESEVSWICHTDITPLLAAYPRLETLTVRGSAGLGLSPIRHESLRQWTLQSGGLPASVVRGVDSSDLPALESLELWLGIANYGGNATVEDLRQVLAGTRIPSLTRLGLRDSEIADELASALASAPVVARLRDLDLSLGLLSDTGASALLAGQPLTHLSTLNLSHHYLSEEMMDRVRGEWEAAGVQVNLGDAQGADEDDRYVAVAE